MSKYGRHLYKDVEVPTLSDFPVWKTIKLGTDLKTPDDFCSALKKLNMKIGRWGKDMLNSSAFTVSDREVEVDLVKVSVSDLGFKHGAYRPDIDVQVFEVGLRFCPAEVGPQLRLEYRDQPKREWCTVWMEPIIGSDDFFPYQFLVAEGHDELWLHGICSKDDGFWKADRCLVCIRPRGYK